MTEEDVRNLLAGMKVLPGMIAAVQCSEGRVTVVLEAAPEKAAALEPLRADIERELASRKGVSKAQVILTAERSLLPGVKRVIAIASGKDSVGKSTIAVNLAVAAAQNGLKTGLLDADIYGPSLPLLMGVKSEPPPLDDNKKMIPPVAHGVKVMSIGFMVDAEKALVWRGPMVHSAITQMLRDVAWGDLDVLYIDMPPGTGDAQLTLAKMGRLSGAIIVSTPQDLALADARRGIAMFRQVNVPILGIIENMSHYCCPNCGQRAEIFGHGGAKAEAEKLGVPFLGEIPLDMAMRETGDSGLPVVLREPEGAHAIMFRKMAT